MRESVTATNEPCTRTSGAFGRFARILALLLLAAIAPGPAWAGAFYDIEKLSGDGPQDPNSIIQLQVRLGGPALTFPVAVFFEVRSGNADFPDAGKPGFIAVDAQPGTNLASVDLAIGRGSDPIQVFVIANGWRSTLFNIQPRGPEQVAAGGGDNQVGLPGQPGQPLEVVVTQDGLPVANEPVSWQIIAGGGITLSADASTTDANGRARIDFTFGPQPTSAIVQATTARGTFINFEVSSRGLTGITLAVVSGSNQSGATGSLADQPIVFSAQDTSGTPVGGLTLDFAVTAGSGSLDTASGLTDPNGRATVQLRYGATPGPVQVRASIPGTQATALAQATAFVANASAASGNGQSGRTGARLAQPLVVQLAQPPGAQSKGLGGVVVNWSVLAGGGTLASPTSVTDANGRASNELTLGPVAGTNSVQAVAPGSTPVLFTATGVGDVPAGSVFEIVSGNGQVLPTFTDSAPLVVRVRTAAGAGIPGIAVQFRGTPAGTVTVTPASATTDASGQASTVARVGLPGDRGVVATITDASGATQSVTFSINGGVENIPGLSPGSASTGGAIDSACPALAAQAGSLNAAETDLLQRCSELVVNSGSDPDDVATALGAMTDDEAAATSEAAFAVTQTQFDNLKARLAALRSGTQGSSFGGLAIAGDGGVLPLSFLPSNIVAEGDSAGGDSEVGAEFSRWGFFATGTFGRGDRDASESQPGFEFDTQGITAGIDYRYSDSLILGMALGYNSQDSDVNGDLGGLDASGWSVSGYATLFKGDSWYADGVFTWTQNDYDFDRRVRYQINSLAGGTTSVDQVASGSTDGDQLGFTLSVGRDFAYGAWSVGPYARAEYTSIDFDEYTEEMSDPDAPGGGLAMQVDSRELTSTLGVLGGKASYTISTSWGVLMPNLQVEWLHEFEDDPDALVTRFVNDPTGTAILIPADEIDSDFFNIGLGLSGVFASGRSAYLYYEHRAGQSEYSLDSLAIGVRIEF